MKAEITIADREAAGLLLGAVTHELLEFCPGADRCYHILAGDGSDVYDLLADLGRIGTDYDPEMQLIHRQSVEAWLTSPYRHHVYTVNPVYMNEPTPYCYCGNPESGQIHTKCWE